MRVMVVEDSLADQVLAQKAFARASIPSALTCIDDGEQALQYLLDRRASAGQLPHLILCDIHLPKLDGFDLLQRVKAESDLLHIPFLMLSGNLSAAEIKRSYGLGANAHIPKPVSMVEFYRLAQSVLATWQSTLMNTRP